MANNRLYIVNTETKEYVCIAKCLLGGWILGNVKNIEKIVQTAGTELDDTKLLIGTEMDDVFYDTFIKNGENLNKSGMWEEYKNLLKIVKNRLLNL